MSKPNISQSLIKRIWDFKSGKDCGLSVKEVDILKKYQRPQSAAMALGCYFEYLCTGSVNRDGTIPESPKTSKGVLDASGKRAMAQSNNFKEAVAYHGWEILSESDVVEVEFEGYNLKVVLDAVIKTPDHEKAVLDIKYSGLLNDKWHEYGWYRDRFDQRNGLKLQPIFYKYVLEKAWGIKDIPFYYAIHSSKNEKEYDVWNVDIPLYDNVMNELEDEIKDIIGIIEEDKFPPIPEVSRCKACPMNSDCLFKMEFPNIKSVSVGGFVRYEDRKI